MRKAEAAYFAANNAMVSVDDKRICERCQSVVVVKTRKKKAGLVIDHTPVTGGIEIGGRGHFFDVPTNKIVAEKRDALTDANTTRWEGK